jgi:hypothetical protein
MESVARDINKSRPIAWFFPGTFVGIVESFHIIPVYQKAKSGEAVGVENFLCFTLVEIKGFQTE